MSNLLSEVHPELVAEWSDKNLPLTPDKITYGSNKSVWWKGACGHEWQTSVKARSNGEKCPICSGARVMKGINDLATLKPKLAVEWSKKNRLKPTEVSIGSHKKIVWKGKCGHEWIATVKSRAISNTGCPYCSHNKILEGYNDLASQMPQATKALQIMVAELTDMNRNLMMSIDVVPVPTDEAVKEAESRLLGVETNITNWQRRQNANNNFSATVPYDMEQQKKEMKEFLDDLTTRDQRMMFAVLTMVHTAESKEQLDNDTEALLTTARKHLCQFAVLNFQQMDGLNTVMPFGTRKIDAFRTLTTESLAVFMPFRVQDIRHDNGIYYGQNVISKNMIIADRKQLLNGNSFILGVSGGGKSFAAKGEITNLVLSSDADIIIIDPEREYSPLVTAMGGEPLVDEIETTVSNAKKEIAEKVNSVITETYWKIGKYIVEFEQNGNIKAEYGSKLLTTLSHELTLRLGRGYSRPNLNNMRKFYLCYENCQTVSDKLTWSHICELIKIDDELERSFYEKQCYKEKWDVRTLRRQMDSALFLRLATSRDKEGILTLAREGIAYDKPEDIIKDTYTLEFLGLPEKEYYSEEDLEQKIIDNLQKFLLELGKGFTFVGRQYPLTVNNVHYHVDLVFYHRILKCFVLIDLKKNSVQHIDIGQMNMYMGYFAKEENMADDNPPIGIILSHNKDELLVEYATYGMDSNLFVSKYELYLPNRSELQKLVNDILEQDTKKEKKGIVQI